MTDIFSLEGQTAVVTGGATGLGLAMTQCMTALGCKVVVVSSSPREKYADTLAELGESVSYEQFDITDTDRTPEFVEGLIQKYGNIDILVNNAGVHCKKPIEDMSVEEYTNVLKVHLVGAFALTKAFVPHMRSNHKGSIIFIASMTSYIGQPYVMGYSTAKAGYLGMIHTLASEVGADGIRVNGIAPGWIDTPMFHKAVDNDPPRLAKIMGRIPAKSVGDPMDIGMVTAFLCSKAARYISGSCIPVDGGALIGF